jgi:hypothetical protein
MEKKRKERKKEMDIRDALELRLWYPNTIRKISKRQIYKYKGKPPYKARVSHTCYQNT